MQTVSAFLPIPILRVMQSWFQGILLNSKQTRGITEAVAVFMAVSILVLWVGVNWGKITGLYVGLVAFSASAFGRTLWLWFRAGPVLRQRATQ